MFMLQLNSQAQTNTLPAADPRAALITLGQAVASSTNWAGVIGYGHSVTGTGKNLGFADVCYNFNEFVGFVAGTDYLWASGVHQRNNVKGGITLQFPLHPLQFLGVDSLTNFQATPFVTDLIATSSDNHSVANLTSIGAHVNIASWQKLNFGAETQYQWRTGDGPFGGRYWLFSLSFSRGF